MYVGTEIKEFVKKQNVSVLLLRESVYTNKVILSTIFPCLYMIFKIKI